MRRPSFSYEQLDWIVSAIDIWYMHWAKRITTNGKNHRLGYAKEQLKQLICDYDMDKIQPDKDFTPPESTL